MLLLPCLIINVSVVLKNISISYQRLQDGDYSKKLIIKEKKYYIMIPINHNHLLVKEKIHIV